MEESNNKSLVYLFTNEPDFSSIHINKGDHVVIKPNLVKEHKENDPNEWRSVITDPQLIRKVCFYVCQQLEGSDGRVTICDAPQTDSSFQKISELLDLYGIAEEASNEYNIPVEILDLRDEEWISEEGIIVNRKKIDGDPLGSIAFNLGEDSLFYGYKGEGKYYGADYNSKVVNQHHHGDKQEYLICATPIYADVFINMPKLKTHKKTGVTIGLKNLVGINADKNWLPHHTYGNPKNNGDEFPTVSFLNLIERMAVKFARKLTIVIPYFGTLIAKRLRKMGNTVFGDGHNTIRSGNWHGNDTTWRMVLDLNRCLLYGEKDGSINPQKLKRYYVIVDGDIGMEGSGPMQGDPINIGYTIVGDNPVAVDAVGASLMGFDWKKIKLISNAFSIPSLPITKVLPKDVYIICPDLNKEFSLEDFDYSLSKKLKPHYGWKGHIEKSFSE